jgi:2-polyprenyl-6-methoxyphenol hydroxylase-like FAD-dependent oxidoreductase
MKAVIVGAGIAGLGAAIALERVGIDSVVLEKNPSLSDEGAAITLWNNGLQALARLQLRTGYAHIFEPFDELRLITFRGARLGEIPVARLANEFGAGAAMVIRPELTNLLADSLAPGQILFQSELVGIEEDPDGVTAVLADGRRVRGDFLIGADGSRATTGRLLAPSELVYCCHLAWRGIARFEHPFFAPRTSFSVIGKGAYFVAHHLSNGRFYWIGTRASETPRHIDRAKRKAEALAWFKDWIEPVRALIEATPGEAVLVNDIFSCARPDYAPRSRSLLVGDAAHVSAPQLGQGAALALEDAVHLAACLRESGWPRARDQFVQLRQARAARVVKKSRAVADAYHKRSPLLVALRNAVLRASAPSVLLNRAGWAARATLPELNGDRATHARGI